MTDIGWLPLEILALAENTLELTVEIETLARKFQDHGIKPLDALHLAFASFTGIDCFCTCDDKFIKKARQLENLNTKVAYPTDLVMELDI